MVYQNERQSMQHFYFLLVATLKILNVDFFYCPQGNGVRKVTRTNDGGGGEWVLC